ncbi:MAG TPA: LOG family protein [Steroidobacteraceae bacterium]|nr:LOG family protein [Steroidobacteraceae bacterium]
MEPANRGASEAGGRTIGLTIGLPFEQRPNPHLSDNLAFEFHYFFMRNLCFAHLARAIVVLPGGFGTPRRALRNIHTIANRQAGSADLHPVVWIGLLEGDHQLRCALRHGVISSADLQLVQFADDPRVALETLNKSLEPDVAPETVAFAKSTTPCPSPEGGEV